MTSDADHSGHGKSLIKKGKDENLNISKMKKKTKPPSTPKELASIRDTMSFVFNCGHGNRIIFLIGAVSACFNGLVGPMLAVLFSLALASASSVGLDDVAFDDIKQVCFGLVIVGIWAFFMTFVQTVCFEITAFRASRNLNLQWFEALLRQDAAFFDVYDVSGIASHVQPTCYLYRRGMGSKLGEGIQYITTVIGGITFAFVASWRISVLVFAVLPFTIAFSVAAIHISQSKTARANQMYQKAGSIAYSTISSLRTVLAFNAVPQMVEKYQKATDEAAKNARLYLLKYGVVNGTSSIHFICGSRLHEKCFVLDLSMFLSFLVLRTVYFFLHCVVRCREYVRGKSYI